MARVSKKRDIEPLDGESRIVSSRPRMNGAHVDATLRRMEAKQVALAKANGSRAIILDGQVRGYVRVSNTKKVLDATTCAKSKESQEERIPGVLEAIRESSKRLENRPHYNFEGVRFEE